MCAVVIVGVGYAPPPPTYEKICGLTYGTLSATERAVTKASYITSDVIWSGVVVLLVLIASVYFSG